jgi:Arabinose-binding domain of AraC transcription regulator, N-term
MERQGASVSHVLQTVDLPFALLERPEILVPLREQFRLLDACARETGDPCFGARLGQHVKISNLSAFGKWVSRRRYGSFIDALARKLVPANAGIVRAMAFGDEAFEFAQEYT